MNARILDPEEWGRTGESSLPTLLPFVAPQNIAVVGVEDDGELAASVAALRVTHFEGRWIAPEHRGNAGVFRSLIRQAYAVPYGRGERWAIGAAADGDVRMASVCARLGGQRLPLTPYALPLGD